MRFVYPLLILGWTLGCIWFWHHKHKACHLSETENLVVEDKNGKLGLQSTAPISFYKSTFLPDTISSFVVLKDSLLSTLSEGQILRISAPYSADETNQSGEENLGIARANAVAKFFEPELTSDRIKTIGFEDSINGEILPQFQIFNRSELMPESENRFVIYFAPGSSKMLNEQSARLRLKQISDRVLQSKENIIINAYTDDIESRNSKKLSDGRAWVVRKGFENTYVRRMLVEYEGNGSKNPVASNKSEEGRALNRRVEIEIVKNK